MSKSKEECLNIISQRFLQIDGKVSSKSKVLALEESIKEISGSEYSLVWTYNNKTHTVKTTNIEMSMHDSILETVLVSKKVFFDNHVQSHKKYEKKLDNPLNINIKSMMIAPILDKNKEQVIGFISAFSSMEKNHEFQRYDTRSIALLDRHSREVIELLLKNNFNISEEKEDSKKEEIKKTNKIVTSKSDTPTKILKKVTTRKTKSDLEEELKVQVKNLSDLEKLLKLKEEELEKTKEKKNEIVLVEDYMDVSTPVKNIDELKNILVFLTKEVTYLSNEQHSVFTLLEIIKNSLYDREQLGFINDELKKSQLINNFSDSLYNRDRMPIINEEFKTFQTFVSLTNLYSKAFSNENIMFNVFIDPLLPSKMLGDIDKIQSVMVHLINNAKGLISINGVVELCITFTEEEMLTIIIKGIQPEEEKRIANFFKSKMISNSLTSNSTGLGLSVSSNLINILGAKLKLTTEGKNEHAFSVSIPVKKTDIIERKKDFKNKKLIKIGILVNEENMYAYINLRRYLDAFSIDTSKIKLFNNYKKIGKENISHFICFENMLSDKIDMKRFSSITILKYSDNVLSDRYLKNIKVNELYVNAYYGMALQQILFPNVVAEDLSGNTLLVEDTFFGKITSKFKR